MVLPHTAFGGTRDHGTPRCQARLVSTCHSVRQMGANVVDTSANLASRLSTFALRGMGADLGLFHCGFGFAFMAEGFF